MLNLKIPGKSCLVFNWNISRAAPGILLFRTSTKSEEYSTNWRINIIAVINRDRVMKTIKKKSKLKTKHFELHYPLKTMISRE